MINSEPSAILTTSPQWTFENVELNKEYVSPQNSGVKLTFTKLPSPTGNIKIEEITLTEDQIKQTGSLSDKAYDITSDMKDGDFSYNLSLPVPESSKGKAVEVKFAEELSNIASAEKVGNTLTKTDTFISVASIDHFTIFFVVAGAVPTTTVVSVSNLLPSWTGDGGGGVFSAYVGPVAYDYVSPGSTTFYDGREAGIIKAGLTVDPTSGVYEDEGLFGFKPTVTINTLASGTLTYDVENQEGTNPVWMTIEIDTGVVDVRSDNTTYQFVPTTNPAGWHTVDAGAGQWQKWNNGNGDTTGNPLIALSAVSTANTGKNVVRAYLRLGMGNSYHGTGAGTVAYIDKTTIGGVTYDFVVGAGSTPTSCTGVSVTLPGGTAACYSTIQAAINAASPGDTINVAAGTYTETVTINKPLTLNGAQVGVDARGRSASETIVSSTSTEGTFVIGPAAGTVTIDGFKLSGTPTSGSGGVIYVSGLTDNVIVKNTIIESSSADGILFYNATNGTAERNWIKGATTSGITGGKDDTMKSVLTIQNNRIDSSLYGISGYLDASTISGNTITGTAAQVNGAGIGGQFYNTTITGNQVSGYTNGVGLAFQDNLSRGMNTVAATSNTISGNSAGVYVNYNITGENITVNNNSITGNSTTGDVAYGILGTGTLDATNNYWGSANPNFTSIISGTVNHDPWWMDSAMTLPSTLIAVFDGIHTTLLGLDIANNIDTCSTHPNACTNLYFEKSISGVKMGRITFTATLDLTNATTQTFLQNLGTYMEANAGSMKFDATTQAGMKAAGAEIKMYGVDALGYIDGTTPIIVKDDAGNILSESDTNYPTLSTISYVAGDGGTITFSTNHFTQFDLPNQDQTTPDAGGNATLSDDTPQVVVTDPNQALDLSIADGTDNPTIDVSAFMEGGTGTIPKIDINSDDPDNADVQIPATKVTGPADWNGVIAAPTITTVTLPETSGETKTLSLGIEIGFTDAKLSFDKAVKITLPGQAGKRAGYSRPGTAFTEITTTCGENSQTWADVNLGADGECKIDSGLDLVIWTKHFTKFASYAQTTNSSSSSSSGGGAGDGLSDGRSDGRSDGLSSAPQQPTVLGLATGPAYENVLGAQITPELGQGGEVLGTESANPTSEPTLTNGQSSTANSTNSLFGYNTVMLLVSLFVSGLLYYLYRRFRKK